MPTFETPNPIAATVALVGGHVRITAGDAGTTSVEVVPTDPSSDEDRRAAELTRVELANGRLLVKAPKVRSWLPRSAGGSVAVTIELPAASDVHGEAALADFECDGPLGECRIKTGIGQIRIDRAGTLSLRNGFGDITVDHATGHADIRTGSGEVRLRELDSTAVIKSSNGDTWVGTAGGDLRLHAANGRISVDVAHANVVAKTANGDVRLGDTARGTVVLETSLGDVEIGIHEGSAAWLDVRASAGRVHNALDAAEAPDPSAETVEVRARTVAGDIVVQRP
jgi:Putative adhesin